MRGREWQIALTAPGYGARLGRFLALQGCPASNGACVNAGGIPFTYGIEALVRTHSTGGPRACRRPGSGTDSDQGGAGRAAGVCCDLRGPILTGGCFLPTRAAQLCSSRQGICRGRALSPSPLHGPLCPSCNPRGPLCCLTTDSCRRLWLVRRRAPPPLRTPYAPRRSPSTRR